MEAKFNFNSVICTTREQSDRLIALGLNKETADLWWVKLENGSYTLCIVGQYFPKDAIPAWSLHRLLLLLLDNRCVAYDHISFSIDETDVFTKVINHIEWLIKEGYFSKEYLVNQDEIEEHCKGVLEYLDYIRGVEMMGDDIRKRKFETRKTDRHSDGII